MRDGGVSACKPSFERLLDKRFKESGFTLNQQQIQRFSIYKKELVDWNKKINLTSITNELGIINKHFLGSVELLRHFDFELKSHIKVADVGSGGGFSRLANKDIRS